MKHLSKKITKLMHFYDKHYKLFMLFSLTVLLLSFVQIGWQTYTTGSFIHKGVSLKGGISLTVLDQNYSPRELEAKLKERFPDNDIEAFSMKSLGQQKGIIVNADVTERNVEDLMIKEITSITGNDQITVKRIGSSLAEGFFKEISITILFAFLFMSLVVFLYFKTLVPSGAVVLSAITDIVVTIAVTNIMGLKLSNAGIAAFLMLLGYSVDTDILLTTRVVKEKTGKVTTRIFDAMKTGLTMTSTTLAAVSVGLLFSQSTTLREIMTILLIGLLVDIMSTWFQNAGILRWYVESKNKSKN